MSRKAKDRLYNLLPSIYRQQDIAQQTADGRRPLQDYLAILEDVLRTLEDDIDGLYKNWFIETCDEWVVPYIGDLVGAGLLHTVKGNASVSARSYVANTVRYRKRKGTTAVLEEIARDITGYDAKAVEFFRYLSATQNLNHVRPHDVRTPTIRNPDPMELVDTPFDTAAHTLDVRSIKYGHGYYNIPNIGIFLWRLTAYPVKEATAFDLGDGKFSFSQIGEDTPLFNHPLTVADDLGMTEEINVSTPIRMLALKNNLATYYGEGKSILVIVDGKEVLENQIVACDLSSTEKGDWAVPEEFSSGGESSDLVAVDPVLGRILFPNANPRKVQVNYYYGFTTDMGGGFYQRDLYEEPAAAKKYPIGNKEDCTSLTEAVGQWKQNKSNAILEFTDSDTYSEGAINIQIPANTTLIIRSAEEKRATLMGADPAAAINVTGEEGSSLVLDGLLLDRSLKVVVNDVLAEDADVKSNLNDLSILHCTLVPPKISETKSLTVSGNDFVTVSLERSICGPAYMKQSLGKLNVKDSIVDSGLLEGSGMNHLALSCYEASLENVTVFGKSNFEILEYASNIIFAEKVTVKRRQEGCVRFSFVANRFSASDPSRMPRCYRCQPQSAKSLVAPRFTNKRYGLPGYGQLHTRAVKEISMGADNGSDMGAFNQAYQAHRVNNLLAAFSEYLPFGLEAGVILVT